MPPPPPPHAVQVGHWTIVRLFFFMFHAHLRLFLGCLLLTMYVPLDVAVWCFSAEEVCMVFLKAITQCALFQPHFPRPVVLDVVELGLALSMGLLMAWHWATGPLDWAGRATYLMGRPLYNALFFGALLGTALNREAVRFAWKRRTGHWSSTYVGRALVILLIAALDFVLCYLLLLPSIANIRSVGGGRVGQRRCGAQSGPRALVFLRTPFLILSGGCAGPPVPPPPLSPGLGRP